MSNESEFILTEEEKQELLNDQVMENDMNEVTKDTTIDKEALLFAALSKCQGELEKATRKATADTGKFSYSYSTIGEILDVARKPMADNGLSIIQMPTTADAFVSVTTILAHKDGGSITSTLTMPLVVPVNSDGRQSMNEAQAVGSIITYSRRYQLAGFLAISQEDADAHGSSKSGAKRKASTKQLEYLSNLIKSNWNWEDFSNKYGIEKLSELDASTASDAIEELNAMVTPQGAK